MCQDAIVADAVRDITLPHTVDDLTVVASACNVDDIAGNTGGQAGHVCPIIADHASHSETVESCAPDANVPETTEG